MPKTPPYGQPKRTWPTCRGDIELENVRVKVGGNFVGEPPVSDEILHEVELKGDAPEKRLQAMVDRVDEIAEIPNSLRQGTRVRLAGSSLMGS